MFQRVKWGLAVVVACSLQAHTKAAAACSPVACSVFNEAMPADGSSGVPLNTELRVRYNGPGPDVRANGEPDVDIRSVRLVRTGGDSLELRGTELLDASRGGRWVVARPAESLAAGSEYALQLQLDRTSACEDTRDWVTVSTFTTGEALDDEAPDFAGVFEVNPRERVIREDMCQGSLDYVPLVVDLHPLADASRDTRYNVYVDGEPHQRLLSSLVSEVYPVLALDCRATATAPVSLVPGSTLEVRAVDLAGNESAAMPPWALPDLCSATSADADLDSAADAGSETYGVFAPVQAVPTSGGCTLAPSPTSSLGAGMVLSLLLLARWRRSKSKLGRVPLALLALLASGCVEDGFQCLAACLDGVQVSLSGPSPLPAGSYEIEVELDGEATVCRRVVGADEAEGELADECTLDSRVQVATTEPTASGEPTGFLVSTYRTPETLAITIRRGEAVIASESIRPAYQRSEICGSTCRSAIEIVTLPSFDSDDRSDAGADAN